MAFLSKGEVTRLSFLFRGREEIPNKFFRIIDTHNDGDEDFLSQDELKDIFKIIYDAILALENTLKGTRDNYNKRYILGMLIQLLATLHNSDERSPAVTGSPSTVSSPSLSDLLRF